MKHDIKNRKDIELLVDTFYSKIKEDDVIGFFFKDVAKVDWNHHLPVMYDFWENILFFTGNYSGSPMVIHRELHKKHPMNEMHFTHWVNVFCTTVDELFSGEKAYSIKERATNIANVLKHKTLL
jgi:hemoglobin